MDKNIAEYFKKAAFEVQNTFEDASDIRLEEYDKEKDEITISFLVSSPVITSEQKIREKVLNIVPAERVYKVIAFDAEHNVSKVKMYH